jgi:glycosyltransferase involved in cell wall biosynthesis
MIPMVTTSDCGALLEIISHDKNGLIVEPSARKISEALDIIVTENNLKERLSIGNKPSNNNILDPVAVIESLMG